jgi:hypothetical protein
VANGNGGIPQHLAAERREATGEESPKLLVRLVSGMHRASRIEADMLAYVFRTRHQG